MVGLTASNKHDLVYENLRKAIERGTVPFPQIEAIMRDSEENDGHHHFYFHPKTKKVARELSKMDEIGKLFFGKDWKDVEHEFEEMPSEYYWAGFRIDKRNNVEVGWTATLYGQEQAQRREREEVNDDETIIRLVREPEKVVLVAKWRKVGVLELKVPGIDPQVAHRRHARLSVAIT